MHPIERLRFVARSKGAPADLLVEESAAALAAFGDDPAGLVSACRRIIDRQLACGPLWWLCARLLCAPDPLAEARAAVAEITSDPTGDHLVSKVPDDATVVVVGWPGQSVGALGRRGDLTVLAVDVAGESDSLVRRLDHAGTDACEVAPRGLGAAVAAADLVLLDAHAVGPGHALVPSGSRAAAATARADDVPVWLASGVGRILPGRMWEALVGRWEASVDPLDSLEEVMALDLVDSAAGVVGVVDVADALKSCDCPVAPELFRLAG